MEEETLDNLEVWEVETEKETPEMDNSHTAKEERYKQQIAWSRAEAERLRNLVLDREVKAAEKDARSLLELHDADPKLADEVAKKFGYDDFADAKKYIDQKDFSGEWVEKTQTASLKEDFEKFYQERKAKETHEEALKKAEKILWKIKDDNAREKAEEQFKKIAWNKTLTIDEAEEFAEMATLYVNKDSLKAERYDEWLSSYASTWMWMGKKAPTSTGERLVVRDGRLVSLDDNKQ